MVVEAGRPDVTWLITYSWLPVGMIGVERRVWNQVITVSPLEWLADRDKSLGEVRLLSAVEVRGEEALPS